MSCTPGPLKNVLNTFLFASVREWICRVLFWLLYGEIERLRMCCRFVVPLSQRKEKGWWLPGSMLLHMAVPRSAWPRGFLLPNWKSVFCSATFPTVFQHMWQTGNQRQPILSFLQIMISIRMSEGYISCLKMNPHSTTPLDHCKDVLVVLLDFMACFWIRIHQSYQFS